MAKHRQPKPEKTLFINWELLLKELKETEINMEIIIESDFCLNNKLLY